MSIRTITSKHGAKWKVTATSTDHQSQCVHSVVCAPLNVGTNVAGSCWQFEMFGNQIGDSKDVKPLGFEVVGQGGNIDRGQPAFLAGIVSAAVNREIKVAPGGFSDLIMHDFLNEVVVSEGQYRGADGIQFIGTGDMCGCADDDPIAYLAGSSGGAIQDAATRAWMAVNHIGADARTTGPVPDIHKFKRQDTGLFTDFWVQSDGAVVVKLGTGDGDAVQFRAHDFDHCV